MKNKKIYPFLIITVGIVAYLLTKNSDQDTDQSVEINNSETMDISTKINKTSIAFYNVENLFDTYDDPSNRGDDDYTPDGYLSWDTERYNNKLSKIAQILTDISTGNPPAVIGFAEIENKQVLKDLIYSGQLAKSPYKIIHKDNHDGRGIDVAAIYREDLFSVSNTNYYPVKLPGSRQPNTRDILHIEGHFGNNEDVHIFYTHWSSRRKGTSETEHKRVSTANIMRSKIDAILSDDSNAKIFIMGDFNDQPSDKSVKTQLVKDDFFNLSAQFENGPQGTTNHQGNWLVFDQIIVSKNLMDHPPFNISKSDAKIFKTEDNTFTHRDGNQTPSRTYGGNKYYGGYSDHYPVYVNLELK